MRRMCTERGAGAARGKGFRTGRMSCFLRSGFLFVFLLPQALLLTGCAARQRTETAEPVTLTVWHVYGGQTDSPLNNLIEEFNQTAGQQQGINLVVTSVSNTNTIHEAVLAAVHDDPGAPELPDLFISYPKTVAALEDASILVDYYDYFSEEELAAYVPSFLEEGVSDGRLVVFPVAKSTEIFFLNKTLFDRFAAETGATLDSLATWEGLMETAVQYTDWTDAQTPDVPGDGRVFFAHDYPFNYFQVGVQSLGEEFFDGGAVADNEAFSRVFETAARAAVQGGFWLEEGYATDPIRTGDAIASVASSASVLYYRDVVTYPDNTSEKVDIVALPCPVFEDGAKLVMQRGAGFCTVRSTPERERAACAFLRWLTEPECNTRFVCSAGYLPVTKQAYDEYLAPQMEQLTSPMYRSLYEAVLRTRKEYEFYTPPQLPEYIALEGGLSSGWRSQMKAARNVYRDRQMEGADEAELSALAQELVTAGRNELLQAVNNGDDRD